MISFLYLDVNKWFIVLIPNFKICQLHLGDFKLIEYIK